MAVTRDGISVRSWVLPGDTADVATVARIKADLHARRLGRCLFVGDAGMYSADNLTALSQGLGPYVLAVLMRKLRDIEAEVLSSGAIPAATSPEPSSAFTRPGRYRRVVDNLQVKEI